MGYDQAIALPALQAGGDESLFNENNKKFDVLGGSIELKVTDVNEELGEIGGVFVHKQPSDTPFGPIVTRRTLAGRRMSFGAREQCVMCVPARRHLGPGFIKYQAEVRA